MRRREPNRQNWNFGHKANCQCPTCVEDRRLRFHGEEIRKADSVSCPECKGEGRVIAIGSGEAIRCPLCLGNGWLPKHFAEARARRLAEGQRRASRGKQPNVDYDALLRESREYYARIKANREQSKPSGHVHQRTKFGMKNLGKWSVRSPRNPESLGQTAIPSQTPAPLSKRLRRTQMPKRGKKISGPDSSGSCPCRCFGGSSLPSR